MITVVYRVCYDSKIYVSIPVYMVCNGKTTIRLVRYYVHDVSYCVLVFNARPISTFPVNACVV